MLRSDLITELQNVAPALSINPLIPLLTHFWFTGTHLLAFNDQIALAAPHATEFKGAVPGTLLELLKVDADTSTKTEIELTKQEQALEVKSRKGRTLIKLAMMAPEFIFTMPKPEPNELPIRALIDGFDHCLLSVGTDTSHAEYLGITLEPDKKDTVLYSVDGGSLSQIRLKRQQWLQAGKLVRAILPGAFCTQAVRLFREASEKQRERAQFELNVRGEPGAKDRYALLRIGRTLLYGRQLETSTPMPFDQMLKEHLPRDYMDKRVPVPSQFPHALERAYIVCEAQRRRMRIDIEELQMKLAAQSDIEDVKDTIKLMKRHDKVQVSVEPRLLRRGLPFADTMVVSKDSVALVGGGEEGGRLYVVACS